MSSYNPGFYLVRSSVRGHQWAAIYIAPSATNLSFSSEGSGVIKSFVRLDQNGSEAGYNTDAPRSGGGYADPAQSGTQTNAQYNHSLTVSSLPIVIHNGVAYREFILDINQNGDTLLSLDQVQISVSSAKNLGGSAASYYTADGTYNGNATLAYDMNAGPDGPGNAVYLKASFNSGSGNGVDMILDVPAANFGSDPTQYVYLYSKFGATGGAYVTNDGFEEWAHAATPVEGNGATATQIVGVDPIAGSVGGATAVPPGEVVHDTATVIADINMNNPPTPTGTVTYNFYDSATPIFGVTAIDTSWTVDLNPDGTVPDSGDTTALAPGSYAFIAVYSGDSTYAGTVSPVEPLTVTGITGSPFFSTVASASPNNVVGTAALSDSATLTGTTQSTGQIIFTLTAPDNSTTQETLPVSGDGTYSAPTDVLATQVGTYKWSAEYIDAANQSGIVDNGDNESLTIVQTDPVITTLASQTAGGVAGTSVLSDSATITGSFTGSGTIDFTLLAPDGGTTDLGTVNVNGDGTYDAPSTVLATEVGTYTWHAVYSGDDLNNGAFDDGTNESLVTTQASPSIVTTASKAITLDASGAPTISDSAVVSNAYNATGNLVFVLDLGNTQVYTTSDQLTGDGNGTYGASYTLPSTGTVAGTYTWSVSYVGDGLNNGAVDQGGTAEQTVVSKANPSIVTTASNAITLDASGAPTISDSAVVSGAYNATGNLVFVLKLGTTQVYTVSDTLTGTGNGTYGASYTLPSTGTVAGTYTWSVSYVGDGNNCKSVDQGGATEQTVVSKANPSIVTTASNAITLDASGAPTISDSAVVSGAYNATGNLVFVLKLGTTQVYTVSDTLTGTGNGTYGASYTLPSTGTVVGTYTWSVSYVGNGNNSSAVDQGGTKEQTVVSNANPKVVTTANPTGTIAVGTTAPTLSDSAVLSGGYYATGTITFTLHLGTSSGSVVYTKNVTISGNGTYTVSTNSETALGLYTWTATYNGNGNNNIANDQGGAAEQVTLTNQVAKNEAATMGFWNNKNGQALLKTYSAVLGNWLGTTYSNLFGNMVGATGTQVASYFQSIVKASASGVIYNTYAQAFTTALDVWVTTTGLGWNTSATGPKSYGFQQGFGGVGLGAVYYNVGSNGASFGVANNTLMKVSDLLAYFNSKTVRTGGSYNPNTMPSFVFYGNNSTSLLNGANNVFNGINNMGDII